MGQGSQYHPQNLVSHYRNTISPCRSCHDNVVSLPSSNEHYVITVVKRNIILITLKSFCCCVAITTYKKQNTLSKLFIDMLLSSHNNLTTMQEVFWHFLACQLIFCCFTMTTCTPYKMFTGIYKPVMFVAMLQ